MKIKFYSMGSVNEQMLKFAVISAFHKAQWVYVRHHSRQSWEIPGGRRETGEKIEEIARRELFEETGSRIMVLSPICDYSLENSLEKVYGRLYFANIVEMGPLPASEIEEVKLFNSPPDYLTYPEIQPKLFEKTLAFMTGSKV
ncbi:NUDIX hydrolase [Peribacillus sp. SCS-26]|uniref:NUDIX hydrolase n=1 Tax=Paraperibacillus marinus TaxID=3115295 RepID=UPI0039057A1F